MSRLISSLRAVGPLAAGATLAAALATLVCASLLVLRAPTRSDRTTLAAISLLSRATAVQAVEHLGPGRGVLASCRVRGEHELVRAAGGSSFAVVAGRVHGTAHRRRAFALAELAACPKLLSIELANRLLSPRSVELGTTRISHRRAIVLLAHSSPRVKLFLSAKTLEPIAVEFRGRRYRGWSFVRAIRFVRPYGRGPPRL